MLVLLLLLTGLLPQHLLIRGRRRRDLDCCRRRSCWEPGSGHWLSRENGDLRSPVAPSVSMLLLSCASRCSHDGCSNGGQGALAGGLLFRLIPLCRCVCSPRMPSSTTRVPHVPHALLPSAPSLGHKTFPPECCEPSDPPLLDHHSRTKVPRQL